MMFFNIWSMLFIKIEFLNVFMLILETFSRQIIKSYFSCSIMDSLIAKDVVNKAIDISGNENVGISGDNNTVFIFNGIPCNISFIYSEMVRQITDACRLDFIRVQSVSTFCILITILIIISCCKF